MDILLLETMMASLQARLAGARIAKIHQPAADTLIFRLWAGGENLRLIISVGPYPRIHLTEASYPNPYTPPRFCQLLRSRLTRLETIAQVADERIAYLEGSGPQGKVKLYVELFGTQGNLILLDEQGDIIDLLTRKQQDREGRELLPGHPYRLPKPQPRISLREQLPEIPAASNRGEMFEKWLLRTVKPMSPAQAKALAWQVGQGGAAGQELEAFRRQWLHGNCQPQLVELGEERLLVACPPAGLQQEGVAQTLSEQLDALYYPLQFQGGRIADRSSLQRIVSRERKRLQKRLEKIEREGEGKASFDERRQLGDLLLANLHQVKKGMTAARVLDYTQTPPAVVIIPLDAKLTPQENAQRLFKSYKKEKRGLDHIARRSAETRAELDWIEQLQLSLDEAVTPEDLFEVAAELKQAGHYREHSSEPVSRKKIPVTPPLNQALSPHGFAILWGRNNRSNDYLSTRIAAPHDYWFHVHRQPGCHLLLKRDSAAIEVPDEDLLFAARLAAGYSRGSQEQGVEVACCQGKDVYKVKGAHPGQVNLRQFSTLRVEPLRLDNMAATV